MAGNEMAGWWSVKVMTTVALNRPVQLGRSPRRISFSTRWTSIKRWNTI